MEFITNIYNWVVENSVNIMAVIGALQVIARLTPTPKDDAALNWFLKMLNSLFSKTNEK